MNDLRKAVALLQAKVATQDLLIAELVAHHVNNLGSGREEIERKYNIMIEYFMNRIPKENDETVALRDELIGEIRKSLKSTLDQYDALPRVE